MLCLSDSVDHMHMESFGLNAGKSDQLFKLPGFISINVITDLLLLAAG